MSLAVRGVRIAGPRIGRSILAVNAAYAQPFNEEEVEQGEALIDEHFQPQLHPDSQVNARIHRMAKLYVQQHGEQLMDFIRQTEMLENQEAERNENNAWEQDEQNIAQANEENENSWSIKTILQWVWSRITLQNTPIESEEELNDDRVDEASGGIEGETNGANSPRFLQSTVALAMLLTVAVMLTRTVSR